MRTPQPAHCEPSVTCRPPDSNCEGPRLHDAASARPQFQLRAPWLPWHVDRSQSERWIAPVHCLQQQPVGVSLGGCSSQLSPCRLTIMYSRSASVFSEVVRCACC